MRRPHSWLSLSPAILASQVLILAIGFASNAECQTREEVPTQPAEPTTTKQAATNAATIVSVEKSLKPVDWEVLRKNGFQEKEPGVLKQNGVKVGDLKRLLQFEDRDLKPIPSSSLLQPTFIVAFPNGRCVVSPSEEKKNVHEDATLVDVLINTNAVAVGQRPTPRDTPANKSAESPKK